MPVKKGTKKKMRSKMPKAKSVKRKQVKVSGSSASNETAPLLGAPEILIDLKYKPQNARAVNEYHGLTASTHICDDDVQPSTQADLSEADFTIDKLQLPNLGPTLLNNEHGMGFHVTANSNCGKSEHNSVYVFKYDEKGKYITHNRIVTEDQLEKLKKNITDLMTQVTELKLSQRRK